ncbi:hypothetical protein ACFQ36_02890 [Arthrobacter sp. GCM10027362]|uniref:hypothetical protein n=1 Tax=Arthrobacter sp. GCM10027362 TaxID=3273379 RepID=UPI00363ECB6F
MKITARACRGRRWRAISVRELPGAFCPARCRDQAEPVPPGAAADLPDTGTVRVAPAAEVTGREFRA